MRAHSCKTYTRRPLAATGAVGENAAQPPSPTKPAAALSTATLKPVSARPLLERSPNSASQALPSPGGASSVDSKACTRARASSSASASASTSSRPPPVALTRPRRRATLRPIDYAEPTEDDIPRRPSSSQPRLSVRPAAHVATDPSGTRSSASSSTVHASRPARARTPSLTKDPARSRASSLIPSRLSVDCLSRQEADETGVVPARALQPEEPAPRRASSLRGAKSSSSSSSRPRASSRSLRSKPSGTAALESGLSSLKLSDDGSTRLRRTSHAHTHSTRAKQAPVPPHLVPLLEACGQARVLDFARYVNGFEMDLVKIGEASYSEVFATLDRGQLRTVLKVIPLRTAGASQAKGGHHDDDDMPEQTSLGDALREVKVTNLLNMVRPLGPAYFSSKARSGAEATPTGQFVDLLGARVVRGAYPPTLMDCWSAYRASNKDEALNASPDIFAPDQHYLVLELVHGGTDLEHYVLGSWMEAASIFWQVVRVLASAEVAMEFEHRDLHWGNLLVRPHGRKAPSTDTHTPSSCASEAEPDGAQASSTGPTPTTVWHASDPSWAGVEVTVIDFTLSRLRESGPGSGAGAGAGGDKVLYADLSESEDLFTGEGDEQFEVYRSMRRVAEPHGWAAHTPSTTVLWLQYLLEKLTRAKGLRKPPAHDTHNCYAYRLLSVARLFLHNKPHVLRSATTVLLWAATSRLFDTLYAKDAKDVTGAKDT